MDGQQLLAHQHVNCLASQHGLEALRVMAKQAVRHHAIKRIANDLSQWLKAMSGHQDASRTDEAKRNPWTDEVCPTLFSSGSYYPWMHSTIRQRMCGNFYHTIVSVYRNTLYT